MLRLNDALGVLSSRERMFLSAMVSFYNAREAVPCSSAATSTGCRTSTASICPRRQVIADLLLNYSGW